MCFTICSEIRRRGIIDTFIRILRVYTVICYDVGALLGAVFENKNLLLHVKSYHVYQLLLPSMYFFLILFTV